jgi:hypothetical protein
MARMSRITRTHGLTIGIMLSGCGGEDVYRLIVEPDAFFCRPAVTGAGLQATHAEKVRAWIPAGEYDLPVTTAGGETSRSQPRAWPLPVSLQWASETIDDAASDEGSLVVETDEAITESRYRALFLAKQPVVGLDGRTGTFVLEQLEEFGRDRTFVVGPSSKLETLSVGLWWDDPPDALLAPCDVDTYFEGRLRRTWRVEHELGVIELDWAIGYWRWDLELGPPVVFKRAAGEHLGVSFEQEDYFMLVHHRAHFDSVRNNFAVLFDEPIDQACGINFTNLGNEHPEFPRSASLLDCDLNETRPIEILEATLHFRE